MNISDFHYDSKTPLEKIDPAATVMDKDKAKERFAELTEEIAKKQIVFHAEAKRSLLVILQGMDSSGKDGTIKKVFNAVNPMGLKIANFKKPSSKEMARDYLWRIHQEVPARGQIGLFNRSHYEDVIITKVKGLVADELITKRYQHINDFERMLSDEGAVIIKIFLHISSEEQKKRLEERLSNPEKHWKFHPDDIHARKDWDKYFAAYNKAFSETHTDLAPWHIVPADHKWNRNLIVSEIILQKLNELDLKFPKATYKLEDIVIP